MQRPPRLKKGDRLAAVTLSWGGPGAIPKRYEIGKRQLMEAFDVDVVEMQHTLAAPDWLARNPQARAEDLMQAFADETIAGIVSTIGGDDSIRLLPFLDVDVIAANPKVFLGYSDTTISHFACLKAGLTSFYGPSIMSGFAENGGLHRYLEDSVRRAVFSGEIPGIVAPNADGWTVEHLDWSIASNNHIRRKLTPCEGWRFLQGNGVVSGPLIGGCLDVLAWLPGTEWWPALDTWRGAVLFLETSEDAPSPVEVERTLRAFAATGMMDGLAGFLFGRPGGAIDPLEFAAYDAAILNVLRDEQGRDDLPVVTGMDFGHTDPMMTLPYGVMAEIDCAERSFKLCETAVR